MKYEARQLPDIPISLPTLIPTNSTVVPTNGTSLPPVSVPTSVPPTSIITTPPPTSIPTSGVVSKPIDSINSTSISVPSTTVPTTTVFVIEANLTASSRQSATVTENITTIITSINGQVTTFTSHLPTSLVDSTPNTSSSPRIAIIASVTAGSIFLLCLALACVFGYRRRKLRLALAASNHKKEVKGLLDGEEFDDDDVVPMRSYQDQHLGINTGASLSSSNIPRSISPAPSLIRSRISESGSIFREEIWPPPGFIDPIEKRSSQVDLSRIVDDVMGPIRSQSTGNIPSTVFSTPGHDQFGSIGSSYSGYGHATNLSSTSASASHERNPTAGSTSAYSQLSIKSTTPLISLTTNSDIDRPSPPLLSSYSDPFASQNDAPLTYYTSALPPGALAPSTPGQPFSALTQVSHGPSANNSLLPGSMHETQTASTLPRSESPLPSSSRLHAASTAQPKKSSPLARVLTGDAKIWLGRSPNSPR